MTTVERSGTGILAPEHDEKRREVIHLLEQA